MSVLDTLYNILINTWAVLGEMSPYLILGFAIAGVMSVLTSPQWVQRHLGGRGIWPTVKATLLGIPLPLCSCGVIPVSASLRKQGASRGATSAFLLATPQTGVDSILATYALLGPVFAVVRPVVALISGILGGLFIDVAGEKDEDNQANDLDTDSCCNSCHDDAPQGNRVIAATRYGFVTLPRDLATHLLIGVVIAGAMTVLIEPGAMSKWLGSGLLGMLLMMVIGLPLYVCATGSIPLAIGFIHIGASPGAALVFLIAGPATNAATIAVTGKLLGKRSTVIYLIVAGLTALGAGYLIDLIDAQWVLKLPEVTGHEHGDHAVGWFTHLSAAVLLGMLIVSYLFHRGAQSGPKEDTDVSDSTTQTVLDVQGMTCSHCAGAVSRALSAMPNVDSVDVDLDAGTAVVRGEVGDRELLVQTVEQLGYKAALRPGAV